MTRKELLEAPGREWDKILSDVQGVWVIPNRKKHESGFACMDLVASTPNGLVRFGGGCDDINLLGAHFRIDCIYNPKLIHIWNSGRKGTFSVSRDLSSIDFIEDDT